MQNVASSMYSKNGENGIIYMFSNKQVLEDSVFTRNANRGEYVYTLGSNFDRIYLIESGSVVVGTIGADGKEVISHILGSGQIFGEYCLEEPSEANEFAKAIENTSLRIIKAKRLKELMQNDSELMFKVIALIQEKMNALHKRLINQISMHAQNRVIYFILELGKTFGRKAGLETLVMNYFTHQEIAGITGSSRQTVTTVLNDLRQKNLIYFDRRRLLIRDLDKLEALCQA
ncbi:MAG: Crp/Fnr family transcriptional regulator [Chitinophagales bacterium]|nr:Crp/Fnr family transcriptional regulator [Bacteroidota bacterium]